MSVVRPLEALPFELVAIILELALDHNLQGFLNRSSPSQDLQDDNASYDGSTILAPIQISSRIRHIAKGQPAIWRSVAAIVQASADGRSHHRLYRLLELCSKLCNNRLSLVDLTSLTNSSKYMRKVTRIATRCAASITTLALWYPPNLGPHRCGCKDCDVIWDAFVDAKVPAFTAREAIVTAGLDLISKASSLKQLNLTISDLPCPSIIARVTSQLQAKPESLRLIMHPEPPISIALQGFLRKLITRVTELEFCSVVDLEDTDDGAETISWTTLLVSPICSNLQHLKLAGIADSLGLGDLFRLDMPLLQSLSINLAEPSDLGWLVITTTKKVLPSLTSLEVPAGIFFLFDAPRVRSLALTHLGAVHTPVGSLKRCPELEDLVLHNTDGDPTAIDTVLEDLIFTESTHWPCRNLQRLSITGQTICSSDWLLDDAFIDPAYLDGPIEGNRRPCPACGEMHGIGPTLSLLAKSRWEHSFQLGSALDSHDSPDSDDGGDAICRALQTIRIFNYYVEPDDWRKLVKSGHCERLWCLPAPDS